MTFMTKNPKTYSELKLVELPQETNTYKPIAHYDLADKVRNYGTAYLGEVLSEGYGLSKDGQQLFGMMRFENPHDQESDLSIGFRSSYDKTLSVGVVAGGSMLVCDNLCLWGQEKRVRKHTKGLGLDIDGVIKSAVNGAYNDAITARATFDQWSNTELSDQDAYSMIGRVLGNNVVRSSHCTGALKEWKKPTFSDWGKNNVHALYQAFTHALKKSRAEETADLYSKLHKFFSGAFPLIETPRRIAPIVDIIAAVDEGRFFGLEY